MRAVCVTADLPVSAGLRAGSLGRARLPQCRPLQGLGVAAPRTCPIQASASAASGQPRRTLITEPLQSRGVRDR